MLAHRGRYSEAGLWMPLRNAVISPEFSDLLQSVAPLTPFHKGDWSTCLPKESGLEQSLPCQQSCCITTQTTAQGLLGATGQLWQGTNIRSLYKAPKIAFLRNHELRSWWAGVPSRSMTASSPMSLLL